MTVMGMFDRKETPEAEREGSRLIEANLSRLDELERRVETVAVAPGSQIARDGEIADYTRADEHVRYLFGSAADHLQGMQLVLSHPQGGLLPMALYTLMRSAIEASALGLWLLSGGTLDKRIRNNVYLTWSNREDVAQLARKMGRTSNEKDNHVRRRMREILDRRPNLRGAEVEKKMPSLSSVISDMGRRLPKRRFTAIEVWRASSGIAHSNSSAALGLLEQRQISPSDGRSALYYMTSSTWVIASFLEVTIDLIDAMVTAFEEGAEA